MLYLCPCPQNVCRLSWQHRSNLVGSPVCGWTARHEQWADLPCGQCRVVMMESGTARGGSSPEGVVGAMQRMMQFILGCLLELCLVTYCSASVSRSLHICTVPTLGSSQPSELRGGSMIPCQVLLEAGFGSYQRMACTLRLLYVVRMAIDLPRPPPL